MLPRYFRFDTADSTGTRTQQLELDSASYSDSYLTTRTRTQLLKLVLNNSNSYLTTRTRTQQLEIVLNNSNSYSQLVLNNSNSYSQLVLNNSNSYSTTRTCTQQLELELKKFIDVPSKLPYLSPTAESISLALGTYNEEGLSSRDTEHCLLVLQVGLYT